MDLFQAFVEGTLYRINIYAVVDKTDLNLELVESKELHEKIIWVRKTDHLKYAGAYLITSYINSGITGF